MVVKTPAACLWAHLWEEAAWGWQSCTAPTLCVSDSLFPIMAQQGGTSKQHGEDLERKMKCFPNTRTACNMVEVSKLQISLPFILHP